MKPMIALAALLLAGPAPADEMDGRILAERWCANCHAVAPDQAQASDFAPSFVELAARRDDAQLAAWMANPHPPMPDPGLSRAQIDALTDYMRSLRP